MVLFIKWSHVKLLFFIGQMVDYKTFYKFNLQAEAKSACLSYLLICLHSALRVGPSARFCLARNQGPQTFKVTVWPYFVILFSCLIFLIFSVVPESLVPRLSTTLSPSPGGAVAKSKVKECIFFHSTNISQYPGLFHRLKIQWSLWGIYNLLRKVDNK